MKESTHLLVVASHSWYEQEYPFSWTFLLVFDPQLHAVRIGISWQNCAE
jgi:hypothetical protein